jgi:hypothetical protein
MDRNLINVWQSIKETPINPVFLKRARVGRHATEEENRGAYF